METCSGLPQIWCVGVAVCAAAYSFDRLFSYVARQEIAAGCRVIVPFGKGNAKRVGIVLSCTRQAQTEQQLKSVLSVVDEQPILSPEMLDLVFWLKEMTFCTYYDAVRTILPAGMQVQLVESISLAEVPPQLPLTEEEEHLLFFLRKARTKREFRRILANTDSQGKQIVDVLVEKGFLHRVETVKEKTHGQTGTRMLRMAKGKDELPQVTKTQQKLVRLMQEVGSVSEKEACYLSGVSTAVAKKLVQLGVLESYIAKPPLHSYTIEKQTQSPEDLILSPEQQSVYERVVAALHEGMHCFLLHGVTGSGKTSVFIRLIDTVVKQGRQVILLVPEIALTPQIVGRFYSLFGEIVAVVHSELSLGQRSETWRKIASGEVKIIIGTRSAVFAPVQSLGLIVVDEEGERTYKSDSAPRYHAISVAKKRCQTHDCPLLLASATPSIESYYYAKRGVYTLLEMKQRYNQAPLPTVEVVDMQEERTAGNDSMFSLTLAEALKDNLAAGNQSLLLLNRRGYHTIISCASCNKPVYCPNCSIPMTYHKVNDSLMCHYCGHTQDLVQVCPTCGSKHLRKMGFGTQRLEEELQQIVPGARILRMDADTTMSRYAYEERFTEFREGKYDIMLGTQMIGKGLDFPRVTLVGVLSVDKALYAGDFRSYERTFSLVTQVVGRGGRGDAPGRAILQTSMPDHYVLRLAAQQAYPEFYAQEIALRRQLIFPPICDICVIGFTGAREQEVQTASRKTAEILKSQIRKQEFSYPIWVLEPVPCIYGRINGKYRYQLVIKCKNTKPYRELIHAVLAEAGTDRSCARVHIYADMNGDIGV
ncbi:primosomal protein N' [Ruminococcus sp.]|uniref:replication restart helicase PriA n=1 Tax=Ruminococcus sp. TaxID=41978 RepID=UPI0025EE7CC5|nr:primosomal protein N' [Ruminococcus sp.]